MQPQESQQLMDEINLLGQFDLHSMQQGIKVHDSAESGLVLACQRLHGKGLVDRVDGGYLTHRGVEAAKHAHILLDTLIHANAASSAA